jgi:mannitol-1-/sugar-/sorbitol-6-phosphatase
MHNNAGIEEIHVQAALIDLDGTLVDSFDITQRWWRRWATRSGLEWDAIAHRVRGRNELDVLNDLMPGRSEALNAADAASLARWEDTHIDLVRATAGAGTLLGRLSPSQWAIVTSSTRAQATAMLRTAGLPEPDVLVSSDDVGRRKPDPEGYLRASAALGVDPARSLVIEDSPTGVQAGRSAGARVLAVGAALAGVADKNVLWTEGLHNVNVLRSDLDDDQRLTFHIKV